MLLAIHSAGHDTGVALIKDGKLIFAVETERLTRVKHDSEVVRAIDWIKEHKRQDFEAITHVSFSVPARSSVSKIENYDLLAKVVGASQLTAESYTTITGKRLPCLLVAHELCHAMAAFNLNSGHSNMSCLVNEGRGHFSRNCVIERRAGNYSVAQVDSLPWYASGAGWTALAVLVLSQEKSPSVAGKAMGLAAYGSFNDQYADIILSLHNDLLSLDREQASAVAKNALANLPGKMTVHKQSDFIRTFQELFTAEVSKLVVGLADRDPSTDIGLSGGCALNLPTNSALKKVLGDRLTVPPICNDSGQAIGAGYVASEHFFNESVETLDVYSCGEDIGAELDFGPAASGLRLAPFCPDKVSKMLCKGEVIAVCSGKAELGPRALGNRSILASADRPGMKDRINNGIKAREWYRPLGGIIKASSLSGQVREDFDSPYMLYSYTVDASKRNEATHVDGTSRLQTITPEFNPRAHAILSSYEAMSGNSVLINTSLNRRDKPIAQTVHDVVDDFFDSDIDAFVFGDLLATRI